jgi:putative ABC transport system substrate-binding protein
MQRREFISWQCGSRRCGGDMAASVYGQQPDQMRRIGVLMAHAESDRERQAFVAAFREGLQNLGWTACQIIVEEQQCQLQP